jgi:hypothetical protein
MRGTTVFVAGLLIMGLSQLAVAQEIPTEAELEKATPKSQYSPYVSQHFPNRVFWGDTHVHTSLSFDAGFLTTLGPEASYRFARGEEVTSSTGVRAKLSRPLDFLVVSDHSEFIGLPDMLREGDPNLLATATGKRWYKMLQAGGREAVKAAIEAVFAIFERWDFGNMFNPVVPKQQEMLQYEYARSALGLGLKLEDKLGVNPFKFGMIGSTDTHTALSTFDEDNFFGKMPSSEPSRERWNEIFLINQDRTPAASAWQIQAAGIAGVWARENTREALFDAMRRKEVYGSTGPRIIVRVFAGWDFQADEVERPDFALQGYDRGVPMGGTLTRAPVREAAPTFMVRVLRDPDGANLDRIQIIKGWLDGKGELHERIFDVAVSDGRKIGADGRCTTPVGNTVDVPNATYKNTIGDALLMGWWKDPAFNPQERAFYYIRVIQIPSPRWTAYDAKHFNVRMAPNVPMVTQEHTFISPIWYTP